ncbi:MAG: acyl carrier protein [Candidatus Hydrogenedentes bacterium]|jgi:acyl carrier protein|nr:acyl carrier protein [Candidatus Hydrogenedentota bacterium]
MDQDLSLKIKQLIADRFDRNLNEITDDARFVEDLGADSLDLTELMMALEEEFDILVDDLSDSIDTVADAINFIEKQLNESKND